MTKINLYIAYTDDRWPHDIQYPYSYMRMRRMSGHRYYHAHMDSVDIYNMTIVTYYNNSLFMKRLTKTCFFLNMFLSKL